MRKKVLPLLFFRRPFEPNKDCLGSDLLWSDPVLKKGTSESIRGIGTFFGPDVTQEFLGRNSFKFKLSWICIDFDSCIFQNPMT